ncbi:MAG: DUF937 domain-containing protein [Methylocella sp.]
MFNLYEILRNAQGGHALDNLATQFGITAAEADAAVKAVVPALSAALVKQASEPHALGSFLGALGEGQHLAAFADPAAAQATATAQKGSDVLNQVLGSHNAREEIALRASSATGLSQDMLAKMLPVIASMIFGGLTRSMENQGFGRILGQLASAAGQGGLGPILGQILGGGNVPSNPQQPQSGTAPGQAAGQGGLGSILGQILGGSRAPTAPGQAPAGWQGSLGGILGSILGNLAARSGAGGAGAGPAAGPAPAGSPQPPGFDAASIQASLEALTKMLQPGTPPPESLQSGTPPPAGSQQSGIHAEINDIMSGKRH